MVWQSNIKFILVLGLFSLSFLNIPAPSIAENEKTQPAYKVALNEGHYDEAITLGKADGTPDGLASAARALLIQAQFYTSDKLKRLELIKKALSLAKQATSQTPDHIEGMLQQSVAIGFRGRLLTAGTDARASKGLLQSVLVLDPENPWGIAGIGAWHGEIVIHAGKFFGNLFYSAKTKHMRSFFKSALSNDPNNIVIRAGLAQILLRLGGSSNRKLAVTQLTIIKDQRPKNHLEKILYDQSMVLLPLASANKKKSLKAYLKTIR